MDIRALGGVYGQTAIVPYASGHSVIPASGTARFAACRAIYVPAKANKDPGTIVGEMSDMPGQVITVDNVTGDVIYPVSMTMISGTSTVAGVIGPT